MNEQDYELLAYVNGWLKLRRGWYHTFAQAYIGWDVGEYLVFKTAKEALEYQIAQHPRQIVGGGGG